MPPTTIPTYRYQYCPSFFQPSGFSFSVSPPRNTFLPHHHLESPTNIFLQASNSSEDKLIVRQVGGPGDNHVQWVSKFDIIPYPSPDSDEEFSSFSSSADLGKSRVRGGNHKANSNDSHGANGPNRTNGGVGNGGGKCQTKTMKSYTSQVHGIVHTANWANDVGDRLWLRSDQPIIKGRRSVPVVNLDKGVNGEVCISSVTWHPQKQELGTNAPIEVTFIGAEYRQQQQRRRGGGSNGPFRMCITQEGGNEPGIIEMFSLEELETRFQDIKSKSKSLLPGQREPTIQPRQSETHGTSMIASSLAKEAVVFGDEEEGNSNDGDDDDDNLSHASFASSTKGKVALDMVARSLSILNFNAAMLDLAALSNQGMGMGMYGFIGNTVHEPPEVEDESDEEDEDEDEEKVWSDCESHYSGRQSVMEGEDKDGYERSRVEDSGSGGDV